MGRKPSSTGGGEDRSEKRSNHSSSRNIPSSPPRLQRLPMTGNFLPGRTPRISSTTKKSYGFTILLLSPSVAYILIGIFLPCLVC